MLKSIYIFFLFVYYSPYATEYTKMVAMSNAKDDVTEELERRNYQLRKKAKESDLQFIAELKERMKKNDELEKQNEELRKKEEELKEQTKDIPEKLEKIEKEIKVVQAERDYYKQRYEEMKKKRREKRGGGGGGK